MHESETQLLRIVAAGPDAGRRVYACHADIRAGGLVPIAATAVEHRTPATTSGESR